MADLEQVMAELGPLLTRVVAAHARSRADRDDLSQDIALALTRALPRFRGESSLRTYVLRVAHHCAIRHIARHRAASQPLDETEHRHDAPGPEQAALAREDSARMVALIHELPLGQRQVLVLTLEGLVQRDIADILGVPENVVSVRLHRARRWLRERLTENTPARRMKA
jgi:RNA polymerase sigma-70 factor (ECF subfamily)